MYCMTGGAWLLIHWAWKQKEHPDGESWVFLRRYMCVVNIKRYTSKHTNRVNMYKENTHILWEEHIDLHLYIFII